MVAKFVVNVYFEGDESFVVSAPSKQALDKALSGLWLENFVSEAAKDGALQISAGIKEVDEETEADAELGMKWIEWL